MAENELAIPESGHLVPGEDPTGRINEYRKIVTAMAEFCKGDNFIAIIDGKKYPKVEWWTTVGSSLGLFPRVTSTSRREGEHIVYDAHVEVWNVGRQVLVSSASAMCSDEEMIYSKKQQKWIKRWRDEYAVKSMAQTRATAKAYRLGLSFLASIAGIEATPAEEMTFSNDYDGKPRKEAQRYYQEPPPEPIEKSIDELQKRIVDPPKKATYEPVGNEYGDENQVSDEEIRTRILTMLRQMIRSYKPDIGVADLENLVDEKVVEYSGFEGKDGPVKGKQLHDLKAKWLRATYRKIKDKWMELGFGQLVNE